MTETSVALLGVKGGPAIRPGSNMPTSILVKAGGKTILVDAGLGVTKSVCDQGTPLTAIDLIVVTHLHSDHYLELGPFMHTAWVAGLKRTVPVIGPGGLEHYWHHFRQAMDFDIALRMEDEGRCDFSILADFRQITEGEIWNADGVKITAMRNVHPPIEETFALKLEAGGKVIVLSGDTAFMPEMIDFAKGADLLVHECMLTDGVEALIARMTNGDERLRNHILRSHTRAEDVGNIAHKAGVGALALNHMVPDGDPGFTKGDYESAVREHWSGTLFVGRDGMKIDL